MKGLDVIQKVDEPIMESHYGQNSDFCVYTCIYKKFLILYVVLEFYITFATAI